MPIELSHGSYEQGEVLSSPGVELYKTCSSYSTQISEQKCCWVPVKAILGQNPLFKRMTMYWGASSCAGICITPGEQRAIKTHRILNRL